MGKEIIEIEGHVGVDAKRGIGKGAQMLVFSVAVTFSYKKYGSEEYEKRTTWYQVQVWDKLKANYFADKIKKGDLVTVAGRPIVKASLTPEGEAVAQIVIMANEIKSDKYQLPTESEITIDNYIKSAPKIIDDGIPF